MKFVFLCNEYPPNMNGGIGTFTRSLGEALAARGHVVHVVGLYDITSITREVVCGVSVSRIPAKRRHSAIFLNRLALQRELREVAESGAIDVIEAPDFEGITAGLPRSSKARVVRLHGSHRYFADERGTPPAASVSFFEKYALQQADAIVSVSDYTANRTLALFNLHRPILTLHNAVNVSPDLPRKTNYEERRRAVYFGTLAEKKGVLALAEAWRIFVQTHPDWTLTVIGRDSLHRGRSVMATMIELLGQASTTVSFDGFAPNAAVLAGLAEFDFAVLPSFSEAFALAPMEAMALGLPVIYSSMSSGPELITDGVNGWLCDPRSVDNLTATLGRAASDPAERARLGLAARRLIETRFSYDDFVSRNIAFYESVLSKQKSTR